MTKSCPNCGYDNRDANTLCSICGTPLRSFGEIPAGSQQKNVRDNAIRGLSLVRLAAVIALVSFAFSMVINFVLIGGLSSGSFFGGIGALGSASTLTSTTAAASFLRYTAIDLVVTLAITFVSVLFLYVGFGELSQVSGSLRTGRTGSMLTLVGLVFVAIAAYYIFSIVIPQISQNTANNVITASQASGILGSLALIGIGGLILLIGVIMLAIGIFRIGDVFDDSLNKAGGILYVLINVVGAILIIIGTSSILGRIRSAPPPASEDTTGETQ